MPESAPIRQEEQGWRDKATCQWYPPELWFARGGPEKALAKRLCEECEVVGQCLAYALASPTSVAGMVAGLTPNQLTKMKREVRDAG